MKQFPAQPDGWPAKQNETMDTSVAFANTPPMPKSVGGSYNLVDCNLLILVLESLTSIRITLVTL